jgi:hypothetical protein
MESRVIFVHAADVVRDARSRLIRPSGVCPIVAVAPRQRYALLVGHLPGNGNPRWQFSVIL